MSGEDQAATIALLSRAETYGVDELVGRIETHISCLFLVGDRAYKLKRAVRFPYVDFSTLAARRCACEAELRLNRRSAPNLYLGVAPIRRVPDGLRLGAPEEIAHDGGDVVDWVVVMRRFDQATLFDALAERDALTPALVADLAATIAAFHAGAAPAPDFGGAGGMARTLDGILAEIDRLTPTVFEPGEAAALADALRTALGGLMPLLDARRRAGFVRHCHGDLHLGNICLDDGRPTLFDAIEFNDAIARIDVLYDIAFLLMDLEYRGMRPLANLAASEYLGRAADYGGLAALPFFLACRAAVRAHVVATRAVDAGEPSHRARLRAMARGYLALGRAVLRPTPARLVAVGGLSGTGKTALGRHIAPALGPAPGAVVLRSDIVRKRLLGADPLTRLGPEGYTDAVTRRVYDTIRDDAVRVLSAGAAVVADAVYGRDDERAGIAAAARRAGVPFAGLWLEAPEAVRLARVGKRTGDASDATAAVARSQAALAPAGAGWYRIDAAGGPEAVWSSARKALNLNEKR